MRDSTTEKGEEEFLIRDENAALTTAGGNADLVRELFAAFLNSIGPHWKELRELHQANDWPKLSDSAHRLHGSAAYCGVPGLKSAVKKLEMAAGAGDVADIDAGMDALEREIERLLALAEND